MSHSHWGEAGYLLRYYFCPVKFNLKDLADFKVKLFQLASRTSPALNVKPTAVLLEELLRPKSSPFPLNEAQLSPFASFKTLEGRLVPDFASIGKNQPEGNKSPSRRISKVW